MLGNWLAICMFFYSKNTNVFASACPPIPFLKTKLMRTKQLIDAVLTDWYPFTFFSCTILVYSIVHTRFLFHLARFQHCNLGEFGWHTQVQTGSRGFYFPCCSILQRNFPNFGMEILALHSAKSFRGLFFLILFLCST